MEKIAEVEEAKALMTEGISWSVMRWLKEKKRVRRAADKANNALWAMQKALKDSWSGDLRSAYEDLAARGDSGGRVRRPAIDSEITPFVKSVKEADDEAYQAHLDAEETFDRAEKRLSTSLAREGARKALLSWELYEKAIIKAEACLSLSKVSSK
ncbi:MAG: hypothetical protein ABSD96_04770 [Candidatus Korobacteraceae bacterium]|jgi:hypothetical protein